MLRKRHLIAIVALLGLVLGIASTPSAAQSDNEVPLGDLARSMRKKPPPTETVIDNDNLSKVMDEVQSKRLKGEPVFSIENSGKKFSMTSPDGTCSLSFDANAAVLISNPYVSEQLPQSELLKLDGPATIEQNKLELSVYNGTKWNVKEITVGLTIVRRQSASAAYYGSAKLIPAAAENTGPAEKRSDLTLLYHLRGSAAPFATTVFEEDLGVQLDPDQDWHWAIIQAMGTRPKPDENNK